MPFVPWHSWCILFGSSFASPYSSFLLAFCAVSFAFEFYCYAYCDIFPFFSLFPLPGIITFCQILVVYCNSSAAAAAASFLPSPHLPLSFLLFGILFCSLIYREEELIQQQQQTETKAKALLSAPVSLKHFQFAWLNVESWLCFSYYQESEKVLYSLTWFITLYNSCDWQRYLQTLLVCLFPRKLFKMPTTLWSCETIRYWFLSLGYQRRI